MAKRSLNERGDVLICSCSSSRSSRSEPHSGERSSTPRRPSRRPTLSQPNIDTRPSIDSYLDFLAGSAGLRGERSLPDGVHEECAVDDNQRMVEDSAWLRDGLDRSPPPPHSPTLDPYNDFEQAAWLLGCLNRSPDPQETDYESDSILHESETDDADSDSSHYSNFGEEEEGYTVGDSGGTEEETRTNSFTIGGRKGKNRNNSVISTPASPTNGERRQKRRKGNDKEGGKRATQLPQLENVPLHLLSWGYESRNRRRNAPLPSSSHHIPIQLDTPLPPSSRKVQQPRSHLLRQGDSGAICLPSHYAKHDPLVYRTIVFNVYAKVFI